MPRQGLTPRTVSNRHSAFGLPEQKGGLPNAARQSRPTLSPRGQKKLHLMQLRSDHLAPRPMQKDETQPNEKRVSTINQAREKTKQTISPATLHGHSSLHIAATLLPCNKRPICCAHGRSKLCDGLTHVRARAQRTRACSELSEPRTLR